MIFNQLGYGESPPDTEMDELITKDAKSSYYYNPRISIAGNYKFYTMTYAHISLPNVT